MYNNGTPPLNTGDNHLTPLPDTIQIGEEGAAALAEALNKVLNEAASNATESNDDKDNDDKDKKEKKDEKRSVRRRF